MATRLTDAQAIAALHELAEKYEALAEADPHGKSEYLVERNPRPFPRS